MNRENRENKVIDVLEGDARKKITGKEEQEVKVAENQWARGSLEGERIAGRIR